MITTNLSDTEFLKKVKDFSLNPKDFTHKAMLRLAYILIKKYGIELAIEKNIEIKEQYFINALHSSKFNRTLTKAYTEILYFFMQKSPKSNFEKLIREFPRLIYNFKSLVKTHYGYNILKEHRAVDPGINRPLLFTF